MSWTPGFEGCAAQTVRLLRRIKDATGQVYDDIADAAEGGADTDTARPSPRCCALPRPVCCEHRLSARMVQSIHAVLRNALQTAVREEAIARNVASLVEVSPPRYTVNRGLDVPQ